MQDLYKELIQLLEQDPALIIEDKLNKALIIDRALKLDSALLKLLLSNPNIKKQFFADLDGVLVFDKIAFQRFVNSKMFLQDSYTQYKNKIGLSTENENYLTDSREVVLVWPHKDCVLEGGQTKEDVKEKRNEIFYNTTLAPDDIDTLIAPKVLTKWKKYDKEGESIPKKISKKDNLIIKGNNLLALHSLKEVYKGQVKLIYIDPPFNTGNDSFSYNDSFNHSTWLTFMKNRLEVAKDLLKIDGSIFINIDAIEEAYLKVLCDEIFGVENFVNVIAVKSSTPSGTKTAHKERTIIKQKDLILFYRKGSGLKLNPQYVKRDKWDTHYSLILNKDKAGNYNLSKLIDLLIENKILTEGSKLEEVNIENEKFKKFYLENANIICRLQSHKNINADKISREKPNEVYEHIEDGISKGLYYNGQVITPLVQGIKKVYSNQSFTEDLGMLACDFWSDIDFQNTQNEGGVSFPTAKKPEVLLHRIIELASNENDIVLDYHLGSGTTCAVAHKMKRRFIGIEQLDYGKNDSVVRLNNVIKAEQSGISKAVNWQGGGNFIYAELSKSNQQFIEDIEKAENINNLKIIWEQIQETAFLSYKVLPKNINKEIKEFEDLSFEDQQKFLIEVLDKNLLYVNKSEINDVTHKVSEYDKEMNQLFYSM
ncbi:MAG: DNA methyltransferase [Bacteroidia bacterium]